MKLIPLFLLVIALACVRNAEQQAQKPSSADDRVDAEKALPLPPERGAPILTDRDEYILRGGQFGH